MVFKFLLIFVGLFPLISFALSCLLEAPKTSAHLGKLICKGLNPQEKYTLLLSQGKKHLSFFYQNLNPTEDYLLFAVPYYWRGKISYTLKGENNAPLLEGIFYIEPFKAGVSKIHLNKDPSKEKGKPNRRREISIQYSLIRRTLRKITYRRFYEKKAVFPLEGNYRISSLFGVKRYINGRFVGFHKGLDIAAPYGTPVRASLSGKVVLARKLILTGNTVIIDHGQGLMTLYAHLSKILVKKGQFVKQGQVIGKVGSTGRSTGPHLHFGVYLRDIAVDPLQFFKFSLKP
jgi:murein DD-endopeptidase MepM/ murein hydrolase activator NlpD